MSSHHEEKQYNYSLVRRHKVWKSMGLTNDLWKGSRAAHRYAARLVQRRGLHLWNNHEVADSAQWIPYGFSVAVFQPA